MQEEQKIFFFTNMDLNVPPTALFRKKSSYGETFVVSSGYHAHVMYTHPLIPRSCIVKLRFTGVYLFCSKPSIVGYLVDAVQTCTHYQCFGAKILKISNFFQINFHFFLQLKKNFCILQRQDYLMIINCSLSRQNLRPAV